MADESTGTAEAVDAPVTDDQMFGQEWDKAGEEDAGKAEETKATPAAPANDGDGDTPEGDTPPDASKKDAATDDADDKDKTPDEEKDESSPDEDDEAAKIVKTKEAQAAWDASVRAVHPDLDKILADPKFDAWVNTLSPEDQKKVDEGCSAFEAAGLLVRFKEAAASGSIEVPAEGTSDIGAWLKDLGVDGIEVDDTDGKVPMSKIIEDYDGLRAMTEVVRAVERKVQDRIDQLGKQFEAIGGDVKGMSSKLGEIDLLRAHPDATKIEKTKAFNDYKAKQPAPFRALWDKGGTQERIAFLARYKEDSARSTRKATGESADRQALHSSTIAGSGTGHDTEGIDTGEESFSDEWSRQAAAEKR